jgi:RNA polymerase sigma-70 factor (ECF subfamily)
MHLEGMDYQQMAEKTLAGTSYSDKELKKKTTAIKKQFTRKTSGSMAKFKSCLERVMRKNNINHADMLN